MPNILASARAEGQRRKIQKPKKPETRSPLEALFILAPDVGKLEMFRTLVDENNRLREERDGARRTARALADLEILGNLAFLAVQVQ